MKSIWWTCCGFQPAEIEKEYILGDEGADGGINEITFASFLTSDVLERGYGGEV